MRKHSDFKIFLSHLRGGKTLKSTTSGRESMSGRRGREGCFKYGVR